MSERLQEHTLEMAAAMVGHQSTCTQRQTAAMVGVVLAAIPATAGMATAKLAAIQTEQAAQALAAAAVLVVSTAQPLGVAVVLACLGKVQAALAAFLAVQAHLGQPTLVAAAQALAAQTEPPQPQPATTALVALMAAALGWALLALVAQSA
jgi:hypothetical protein